MKQINPIIVIYYPFSTITQWIVEFLEAYQQDSILKQYHLITVPWSQEDFKVDLLNVKNVKKVK